MLAGGLGEGARRERGRAGIEAARGKREKKEKKGSLEGGEEGNLYTNLCLLKWLTDLKLVSVCVYVDVHMCVNICILLLHVLNAHQQLSSESGKSFKDKTL